MDAHQFKVAEPLQHEIESLRQQLVKCQRERDEFMAASIHAQQVNEGLARELYLAKLDAERLDFIAHEYIDIQAFEMPTGADDADIGWRCLQWHCGEKNPRVVSEVHHDNLREAIDAARKEPTC